MGEAGTKSHRCSNCGAPLALGNAPGEILRCRYCGSDHRLFCPKAQAEAELRAERRVGSIAAPFIIGPLFGLAGFFAWRDLLYSPYEGKPAMALGVLFLLIGLMSYRVPAALGLVVVGLGGVLKPFLWPVMSDWGEVPTAMSPFSETSFYYLVPGVLSTAAGLGFFSSLKVRELGPASRALIPRPAMVLATAAGIAGGYFLLGESHYSLASKHQDVVEELVSLAREACTDGLASPLEAPLDPPPSMTSKRTGNVLMVSCEILDSPRATSKDPLYLDGLARLRIEFLAGTRHKHAGAPEWQKQYFQHALASRYLITYKGHAGNRELTVVDRTQRSSLRITDRELRTDTLVFSALADVTGGHFPEGKGVGDRVETSSLASTPKKPISAEFRFHSAQKNNISGTVWVYGEVTNTSSIATDKTEVLVVMKDADGRELRSQNGYSAYPLMPGETGPVGVMITKAPAYDSLAFETVPRRLMGTALAKDLTIEGQASPNGRSLSISGTVRNSGRRPARFVQAHILVYDKDDKLVGLRNTYAKAETIEPGASARFLDTFYGFEEGMRVEYRVSGSEGRR